MKNLCLIYNYAQHYRSDIFKLIDGTSQCEFVFGDKMDDVKKMDYSILSNFKKEVRNTTFIRKPFYYQKGSISLLKEKYTSFLILGDVRCLSTWAILFLAKFTRKRFICGRTVGMARKILYQPALNVYFSAWPMAHSFMEIMPEI